MGVRHVVTQPDWQVRRALPYTAASIIYKEGLYPYIRPHRSGNWLGAGAWGREGRREATHGTKTEESGRFCKSYPESGSTNALGCRGLTHTYAEVTCTAFLGENESVARGGGRKAGRKGWGRKEEEEEGREKGGGGGGRNADELPTVDDVQTG